MARQSNLSLVFFLNDPATPEIYSLSLHDALPIPPPLPEFAPVASRARKEIHKVVPLLPNLPAVSIHGCTARDRKSTRLNSSHANISYAVFCLEEQPLSVIELHQQLLYLAPSSVRR